MKANLAPICAAGSAFINSYNPVQNSRRDDGRYDRVIAAAEAFVNSYNQSQNVYRSGSSSSVVGKTLASYYVDKGFIGFYNGMTVTNNSQASLAHSGKVSVDFFDKQGYGHNVNIVDFKVEPHGKTVAAVSVDWVLTPKNGAENIEWTTVYGYRLENGFNTTLYQDRKTKCAPEGSLACEVGGKEKTQGWFEYIITDNEIEAMLERFPNYFDSYA